MLSLKRGMSYVIQCAGCSADKKMECDISTVTILDLASNSIVTGPGPVPKLVSHSEAITSQSIYHTK